jgi:hypothetical protein
MPVNSGRISDSVPAEALVHVGEALIALTVSDRALARERLTQALDLAPTLQVARDRMAQLDDLDAFRTADELPLAEELLDLARKREATASLLGRLDPLGSRALSTSRSGVGEAFGLDRLGAQVFADFVIVLGGGNP